MSTPNNFTIVSDPGIDDLIALALVAKLTSGSKHHLISTFGNATEAITANNAQEFLGLIEEGWSYSHGADIPHNGVVERPWPDYFHGPDGVWGVHTTPKTYKAPAMESPTSSNLIISLAPLTELLKMMSNNKQQTITLMGGAFDVEGNETKYAETNIAFDPDAARLFFEKNISQIVRVVPLNVTRKVHWSKETVEKIPENSGINTWLKNILLAWFEKYNHEREEEFNLHDPLAVYLHFFPEKAVWVNKGIVVEDKGEKRGQTIFSNTNHPCDIALDLKDSAFITTHIFSLLFE